MNKNKLIKIIILSSLLLLFSVYFLNLILRNQTKINSIDDKEMQVEKLNKNIKKEKKNKYNISLAGENFLKNAYFDKKNEYFEDYIRTLFEKYNLTIKIYESKMDEKDYAEIYLNIKSGVYDFFSLLNKIENGDKLVVIKDISISKQNYPYLDINLRLGGYYKKTGK